MLEHILVIAVVSTVISLISSSFIVITDAVAGRILSKTEKQRTALVCAMSVLAACMCCAVASMV